MTRAITEPSATGREILELATGLFAITAGVLWFWIYQITTSAAELCTTTPSTLAHCPLCYPAVLASLAALVGGGMLLRARLSA